MFRGEHRDLAEQRSGTQIDTGFGEMHSARNDKVRLVAEIVSGEELLPGVQLDGLRERLEPIHPEVAFDRARNCSLRPDDLPQAPRIEREQQRMQNEHRYDVAQRAVENEGEVARDAYLAQARSRAHEERHENQRRGDVPQEQDRSIRRHRVPRSAIE